MRIDFEKEDIYYDLIELPSKRHIPVPIALEIVSVKELSKIPIAKRMRNHEFFYCGLCKTHSFYQCHHSPCTSCYGSYRYFLTDCKTCTYLKNELANNERTQATKEIAFKQLMKNKQYQKMRYIRSIS